MKVSIIQKLSIENTNNKNVFKSRENNKIYIRKIIEVL